MFKDLLWEDLELDIPIASLQNLTDIFFHVCHPIQNCI